MKVLVLGAGKMTSAILLGLKSKMDVSAFEIYSPSGTSAKTLAEKIGAKFVQDLTSVSAPDWILVGCKPQQLPDLKEKIGDKFSESLFVSMLAALPEIEQRKILNTKRLIRIMPNLPVQHGVGVTLLSSESAKEKLPELSSLFSLLGLAMETGEKELEELTLLTGSGPAFFYEFAQDLAGSFSSLDEQQREKLVRGVLLGAGFAVGATSQSLIEMTNAVTSKGGVTIAVLEKWRELDLLSIVKRGIESGKKRSLEISSLLRK